MKTIGVCMVKDEIDVLPEVLRHMATQVDHIIVADNMSTDGTFELLHELKHSLPLSVRSDEEVGYFQSAKMTALAHVAGSMGAAWVVPFDADEVWYSPFYDHIGDFLEALAPQWFAAAATLYDHVPTAEDDASLPPIRRIGWRRQQATPLFKMAGRYHERMVVEQGNHSISYPGGTTVFSDHLVVRHFPWRSEAQFVSKVRNGYAAYRATDLPDSLGAHWRRYGEFLERDGEQSVIDDIYHKWFWAADPLADESLIYDPAPVR